MVSQLLKSAENNDKDSMRYIKEATIPMIAKDKSSASQILFRDINLAIEMFENK
jgi:hypothetical protein